jgi:L-seryl-tRNA(Ser) seleniumtransferase
MNATLHLYENAELVERSIPLLSLLATSLDNLRQRAERLAAQITASGVASVEILATTTFLTAALLPSESLPTIKLALTPTARSAQDLADALRLGTPSVIGTLAGDKLLLDLRSVPPREDIPLIAAIEAQRSAASQPLPSQIVVN